MSPIRSGGPELPWRTAEYRSALVIVGVETAGVPRPRKCRWIRFEKVRRPGP